MEGGFGKTDAFALFLFVVFAVQGATFYLQCHSSRIALFSALACLVVLGLWVWKRALRFSVEFLQRRVFPVVLIVLGVSFALFFAPGTAPDEIYHFKSAYIYSNLLSLQPDDSMRVSDSELIVDERVVNRDLSVEHWEVTNETFELLASDTNVEPEYWLVYDKTYEDESIARRFNLPLVWLDLFPALGIMLARLLGLGAVALFYMGRLFNVLGAALLIIAAVRLTPIGKNVFIAISLMPMTLHLLGSYSYDAPIISLSILLTALLLCAIRGEGRISSSLCIGIVLVASLLAPCKVVYATINFIVLFVPSRRFASRKSEIIFKLCTIALPLALVFVFRFMFISALLAGANGAGADDVVVPKYTIGEFLEDPFAAYTLFANTFFYYGSNYLLELPGGALGWLDPGTQLPPWLAYFLDVVLLVSCIRSLDDKDVLPTRQRCIFIILFILSALAIVLTMALDWTPNTETLIRGVQGRYFIPVLALFLVALRPKCIQANCNLGFPIIMFLSGFNLLYLAYITLRIATG